MRAAGRTPAEIAMATNRGAVDAAGANKAVAGIGLNATTAQDALKTAANTQMAGYGVAGQAQGTFSRAQLSNQLLDMLSNYTQQGLNLKSTEALKIIDLAQSLSGQQFNVDQANNNMKETNWQNQATYTQSANAAATAAYNNQYKSRTDAFNTDWKTWDAETKDKLAAIKTSTQASTADKQMAAANWRAQLAQDGAAYRAQLAAATSKANKAGTKIPNSAYDTFFNSVSADMLRNGNAPNKADLDNAIKLVTDTVNSYNNQGPKPVDEQEFAKRVMDNAAAAGVPDELARALASDWYQSGLALGWTGASKAPPT
jgi:hypothetical protein